MLVNHADAAIARLEEAEHELNAIAGLEGGELRIASFPSASATLLTRRCRSSLGRHPEVRLGVTEAEPEESVPRLRAGRGRPRDRLRLPALPASDDRDIERRSC